jgi:hypothetical protein
MLEKHILHSDSCFENILQKRYKQAPEPPDACFAAAVPASRTPRPKHRRAERQSILDKNSKTFRSFTIFVVR